MEESLRQEMEMALEGKSEATKIYYREYAALLERYVALLNMNQMNPEVWRGLQKEMMDKIESRYAAYLKERADQGLPPDLGRGPKFHRPNLP